MKTLRLPNNWGTLGFTAKAGWLTQTGQARDYSEACSILGRRGGRKRRKPPSVESVVAQLEKRNLF